MTAAVNETHGIKTIYTAKSSPRGEIKHRWLYVIRPNTFNRWQYESFRKKQLILALSLLCSVPTEHAGARTLSDAIFDALFSLCLYPRIWPVVHHSEWIFNFLTLNSQIYPNLSSSNYISIYKYVCGKFIESDPQTCKTLAVSLSISRCLSKTIAHES